MRFPVVRRGVLLAAHIGNSVVSPICLLNFKAGTSTGPEVNGSCLEADPGSATGKPSNFQQKPAKGFKQSK